MTMTPDVWTTWGPFRADDGTIWAEGTPQGGPIHIVDIRGWGFMRLHSMRRKPFKST